MPQTELCRAPSIRGKLVVPAGEHGVDKERVTNRHRHKVVWYLKCNFSKASTSLIIQKKNKKARMYSAKVH